MSNESKLEAYIKSFVYNKTGENVDVVFNDAIVIQQSHGAGSVALALFWVNVVQHRDNFPQATHRYTKIRDKACAADRLVLKVGGAQIAVNMKTGALILSGQYIFSWFRENFQSILDRYDQRFYNSWTYVPQREPELRRFGTNDMIPTAPTDTENYLNMLGRSNTMYNDLEERLHLEADDLVPGLREMNLDDTIWEGAELRRHIEQIEQVCFKDGFTFISRLWRSLLYRWFDLPGAKIYLCSPFLDTVRLHEIVSLYLRHRVRGQLELMYVRRACDPINKQDISDVKKSVMASFDTQTQPTIEYHLFRKIFCPVTKFHAKFAAALMPDGDVELLVTSANFHQEHFSSESIESVQFLVLPEAEFRLRFLSPLDGPAVATW